jgi:chromate transporter
MSEPTTSAPSAPSFSEALRFWLKLGFISFGGPAGQIAIMHQELVERRRWISERRFLHALNYCMLLPGPEAQQLATYLGWLLHKTWGGIVAGALFVLPSLFILIALSWVYLIYGDVPIVAGIFYGIKPAVTAIVVFAAYRIGTRALANGVLWMIAAAAFVALFVFNVPFPAVILGALAIGALGGKLAPEKFRAGGGHGATGKVHGPSVIDDDTPPPQHALFSAPRLIAYSAIGLAIWGTLLGGLTLAYGWESTLTQIGWFFTKAALVTFGGAYAVLPYVYQGGVDYYQWLSPTQMIDGLALGESTPGPLIMIVAFVGFFGPENLLLAGAAGATIATIVTFLPSFLFILVGGPLVESTRGEIAFTAPLTAITAAVVGVIMNLAMFFAYHVLWPAGFGGRFDWIAAVIGIASFIALWRYKIGIMTVVGVTGALGAALVLSGLVAT